MPRSPVDVEFARFARTRDPAALAAVFDAVAPNLMLVAMHLSRDAADAEDLVQTVFLQAMRDAARYDAARPVLAWLLGILEHRARDLQRRAHRRRERGDAALANVAAAEAPGDTAVSAETLQQIAAALDGLPPSYREVLTLRLVHGLRAVDIAHAQGAPPETVRTRLHRGLELLRRVLPRSLMTPIVLALLGSETLRAGSGLGQVRANLLRALPVGTASVLAIGGMMTIKWLAAAGAIAIAALLYVSTLAPGNGLLPAATNQDSAQPIVANAPAQDPTNAARAAVAGRQRSEVPTPTPDTNTTVLRGRVVAAETGLPLAGTIVHLQSEPEGSRGKEPDGWTEPADVITGDDGGFEIRFVPPPTRMFNLQFHEPERVARYVNWDSLRTGVTVDLGSVPMAFGAEVQFGVFDEQGRPRPGMSVWLHKVRQLEDDGPSTAEPDFAAPRTDTDGYAVCPAFSPGRWRYEIKDRPEAFGTILVGDKIGELEVVRQQTVSRTVVLRQPTNELSVSGVVHDAAGAPAAGLELAIFDIPQGRGYLPAMTADDGTFLAALAEPPDSNRRFRFALPDGAIDFELVDDGGEFAWGTHGLQVVVRRRQPASLELTVVDAATGAPVEDFGASCRGEGSDILPPSALQSSATAHHPGGVLRFDNLPPAPYRVSVQPKAPLCERAFIPIAVSEGRSTALQVALEPPAPLQVTVVDSSTQQPLPDVTVHLGRVIPEQHLDRVSLRTYRVPLTGSGGIPQYGNTTEVVTLDEATTRADGLVTLHAAPETPALVVIADGDRCVTTMLKDVRLPRAGNSLRIAVATAAILHGRLQPLQFLQHFGPSAQQVAEAARKAAVSLTVASDIADRYPELRLHSDAGVRMGTKVAADGTFTIAAIPPGRYEVFVAPSTQLAVDFSSNTDLGPLATVDMIGGEDQAIELTLDQYMPGIVRGRFLVDGVPWQGEVGFARLAGSHMQRYSLLADTNGTATSYWLLPGTYLAFAAVRQGYKTEYVLGPEPFVLTPNGEVDLTAMLHRRRIAVELRDANDQPVANRRLVLQWLEHPEFTYSLRHGEVTDAQGRLQFDPALPGRLCIRAFADGQSVEDDTPALVLGEASADATELTLRLPK